MILFLKVVVVGGFWLLSVAGVYSLLGSWGVNDYLAFLIAAFGVTYMITEGGKTTDSLKK